MSMLNDICYGDIRGYRDSQNFIAFINSVLYRYSSQFYLTYGNFLNFAYMEIRIWVFLFQNKNGGHRTNKGATAEASDR